MGLAGTTDIPPLRPREQPLRTGRGSPHSRGAIEGPHAQRRKAGLLGRPRGLQQEAGPHGSPLRVRFLSEGPHAKRWRSAGRSIHAETRRRGECRATPCGRPLPRLPRTADHNFERMDPMPSGGGEAGWPHGAAPTDAFDQLLPQWAEPNLHRYTMSKTEPTRGSADKNIIRTYGVARQAGLGFSGRATGSPSSRVTRIAKS